MSEKGDGEAADIFAEMLRDAKRGGPRAARPRRIPDERAVAEWGEAAGQLQKMWLDFHAPGEEEIDVPVPLFADPSQWLGLMQTWYQQMPQLDVQRQQALWSEGLALWEDILAQYGIGTDGSRQAGGRASTCRAPTGALPIRRGANSRFLR